MDAKLLVIAICILAVMMAEPINADFFYNRQTPSVDALEELGLECVPGRTVIRVTEKEVLNEQYDDESSAEDYLHATRRKHMTVPTKDESCRICVCSVDGKHEYCSNRPAMNVNECMMIQKVMDSSKKSLPFEHEKSLAYRIRRDYIWHNDEIPYESNAACRRGHSYYSNSLDANNTDIDVPTDVESLLDYENSGVCFYCVCAVNGRQAGCISRNPWFCEYYRFIRNHDAGRDMYRNTFQQDRPSYFRLLSHRLRRTMDNGIYDFIDSVGGGVDKKICVPFVSQYTDCTDDNICSGCTKCHCVADGKWECESVQECDEEDNKEDELGVSDEQIENALKNVEMEMKKDRIRQSKSSKHPLVPNPTKSNEQDDLIENFKFYEPMDDIMDTIRQKRSMNEESKASNDTVNFFGVLDELNEDTLKNSNITGTLPAQKVASVHLPNLSRRAGALDNTNTSLQIEFSEPNQYNHITDNKIDIIGRNDVTFDGSHDKLDLIGNSTQKAKDKELSKLVVNELKKSSEVIGDSAAPVISNITFTPENDTFTAMAFIAGNLLNKLWNIEKDAGGTSIETEVIKHEKIANLLELFKEPLTLKQETFLKTALAQLSSTFDTNKDINNISICENIEEAKKILDDSSRSNEDSSTDDKKERKGCKKTEKKKENSKLSVEAISRVNNVMALIQKFDSIQEKIKGLEKKSYSEGNKQELVFSPTQKKYATDSIFTNDDRKPLNNFQSLLEKITGTLYPKDSPNKMKTQNRYKTSQNIKNKLKNMYDIDLNNMNVTSKDKLIMDYLSHIEANPECLLKANNRKTKTLANVEGNILLNLSEFFKIKSFSDLVKLLEPKKEEAIHKSISTTEKPVESTTVSFKLSRNINYKESSKLETTKDKFKAHLKTILEDLIEIQNARGVNTKNINLVDALPCIYNILNADKEISLNKTKIIDPLDKVTVIFNELKNDLKSTQTRRTGVITGPRPKSAVVWERTIKALNEKPKPKTRRTLVENTPKSFEEIKKIIEKIESSGSNTYKNYALLTEVPAADKLVLLRTLEADIKAYINALEVIKLSIDNLNKLPLDKQLELLEFMTNAATHINLNEKVVNNINKPRGRRYFVDEINSSRDTLKNKNKKKQALRFSVVNKSNDDTRVSRDIVINQLIKNRVQLYMKLKETKGIELDNDMNYNIAQKILLFLESGNNQLARELYKVFVAQNVNESNLERGSSNRYSGSPLQKLKEKLGPMSLQPKRPVIQFEEQQTQDHARWLNQDKLIKQLLNVQNMS